MENPKTKFVTEMFDDIHGKYDSLNTILSAGQDRRWRKQTVRDLPSDGVIIDLCAGGGEMAQAILSRKSFTGMVAVTDISKGMLSLTAQNMDSDFQARYFLVVCDAERLPFKDGIFSGATSAFCLRNLSDLSRFTAEVSRCLLPGGMARHLEIAHPPNKLLALLFEFYFYKLSPLIARLFTAKTYAYRYLPNSLRIFPPQEKVLEILGKGWKAADYKNIMGGISAVYTLKKESK
jgi:demethylmenaquinone methyltransferase / 2-methoxy-6-polyprenyl-1,4-benzoquinol methylase